MRQPIRVDDFGKRLSALRDRRRLVLVAAGVSLLLQVMDQLIGRAALPSGMGGVFVQEIALVLVDEVVVVAAVGRVNLLKP
ncbi:hypothetical protein [Bradyrhizobium sp. Cp5.3]|uniref:hypothetical protein n=1 Tax=Bradyrhizobium sp. Cp5.3 TaxID=443598 RepID=UPI0012EC85C8|nr:hypothetical protein [Bradyrhizobium sp. Cp5.3]